MKIDLKFVGTTPYPAYAPTKKGDAGLDLRSQADVEIPAGECACIPTGIALAIPEGVVGMVCSRSGLARSQIAVLGDPGIIDSGYRGEIHITLKNYGNETFHINKGDRVAQLLLISHVMNVVTFNEVNSLDETERGATGFGSSGRN